MKILSISSQHEAEGQAMSCSASLCLISLILDDGFVMTLKNMKQEINTLSIESCCLISNG